MSSKAMSFKAKINNYAKANQIPAQVVLQNVMFERFLERLSKSEFRDKFVLKGGVLISALVGLDTRVTMDLDITLRKLPLTEKQISEAIKKITEVELDDEVFFKIKSIAPIRKDDVYGGYRVKMDTIFEDIITPLSIDLSTGDVITPDAMEYEIIGTIDENVQISLWGYNIETVLAEKMETLLSRGVTSTRPRDFYDIYILSSEKEYSPAIFREALKATSEHRGSSEKIQDIESIIEVIEGSDVLRDLWEKYRKKFKYAEKITFEDTINAVKKIME
ncbi:MAG TPA: nucleotidyl transferase AbiEii/AbiGii toxin family protein [Mogibacterium sp.]|nr:nucleotidyl transferase AbiEii/AbiGii toxin family protein [Mogibacterium sp.]